MKGGTCNALSRFFVLIRLIVLFLGVCIPWGVASAGSWTVHSLADNSGSISLPPGWKLTYNDFIGSVSAEGPARQTVDLGRVLSITDATSQFAGQAQNYGAIVAPFSDPLTALKYITPQLNAITRRNGGPILTTDKIISVQSDSSQIPGAKAAWINSAVTRRSDRGAEPLLVMGRYECWPGVAGVSWSLYTSFQFVAPAATFNRDVKTMIEIARSWKVNDKQVYANVQGYLRSTNQNFTNALHSVQKSLDRKERSSKGFREGTMGIGQVRDPDNPKKIIEVPSSYWDPGRNCYVNPANNNCYAGE